MKEKILDIDNEMRWSLDGQKFFCGSVVDYYKEQILNWEATGFPNNRERGVAASIHCMINNAISFNFFQYAQIMVLLFHLIAETAEDASAIIAYMKMSYKFMDFEISREQAMYALKYVSKSDLRNSGKEYIKLLEEDRDTNVADILGMILDELESKGNLSEEDYDKLLTALAKPIERWRNYDLPKATQEGSYKTIKQIVDVCYEWKAYQSLLRLLGILFIAGGKSREYFYNNLFFMAKVAFDLGYLEVARQCFLYVDEKTNQRCWDADSNKYRVVLNQKTHLEVPEEAFELEKVVKQKLEMGEIMLYTKQEVWDYLDNKIAIPFKDSMQIAKQRAKIGEKAVKKFQKYKKGTPEEQMKGIDEAFAVLTEDKYLYEDAGYLFFTKGKIYERLNDYENAYSCFLESYKCLNAKQNPILLLSIATQLFVRKRNAEGIAYVFRAYMLISKEQVFGLVERAWKHMEERYLK